MKHLILVAHGSRRVESNNEIRHLVKKMTHFENNFDFIGESFLELAEPSIPDGIEQSIKSGAKDIIIMPYFLSAGRHVVKDVPKDVKKIADKYPNISIKIAPYLGKSADIIRVIFNQVDKA